MLSSVVQCGIEVCRSFKYCVSSPPNLSQSVIPGYQLSKHIWSLWPVLPHPFSFSPSAYHLPASCAYCKIPSIFFSLSKWTHQIFPRYLNQCFPIPNRDAFWLSGDVYNLKQRCRRRPLNALQWGKVKLVSPNPSERRKNLSLWKIFEEEKSPAAKDMWSRKISNCNIFLTTTPT